MLSMSTCVAPPGYAHAGWAISMFPPPLKIVNTWSATRLTPKSVESTPVSGTGSLCSAITCRACHPRAMRWHGKNCRMPDVHPIPLVGRERELVALLGEAVVGETRLAEETVARATSEV